MPINNFEQIKSMLVFDSPDDFYHLQIIKRKKENLELGSNSYVVKTYYVTSPEYLDSKMPEIINLCDFNNARACINLNRRSFEKMAFQTLKKITDQIMNRDFKSVRKAYESACGVNVNEPDKKWILDVDWVDFGLEYTNDWEFESNEIAWKRDELVNEIMLDVGAEVAKTGRDDSMWVIPTRNGAHVITRPFNPQQFEPKWNKIVIQKNNPTILYMP